MSERGGEKRESERGGGRHQNGEKIDWDGEKVRVNWHSPPLTIPTPLPLSFSPSQSNFSPIGHLPTPHSLSLFPPSLPLTSATSHCPYAISPPIPSITVFFPSKSVTYPLPTPSLFSLHSLSLFPPGGGGGGGI